MAAEFLLFVQGRLFTERNMNVRQMLDNAE